MKTVAMCVLLAAAALAVGCDKLAGDQPDEKAVKPAAPAADAVNKKPNPSTVADDPRVIQAKRATDAVTRALLTIHQRLVGLRERYDDKVVTEKDLKKVVPLMVPLVQAAREDCDTIRRAVDDLRTELQFAQPAYLGTAGLYRERAALHSDPDLRAVTLGMADEFDRLAADVPGRRETLLEFDSRLADTRRFLADTERCLHETSAALAILTAGPDGVTAAEQSRGFRKQLEDFITVVEVYQRKLLARPAPPKSPADTRPTNPGVESLPPSPPNAQPKVVPATEPPPQKNGTSESPSGSPRFAKSDRTAGPPSAAPVSPRTPDTDADELDDEVIVISSARRAAQRQNGRQP